MKEIEVTLIREVDQAVRGAVATEAARYQAASQGAPGLQQALVAQAGSGEIQVPGTGRIQVSLPSDLALKQKVEHALARPF